MIEYLSQDKNLVKIGPEDPEVALLEWSVLKNKKERN